MYSQTNISHVCTQQRGMQNGIIKRKNSDMCEIKDLVGPKLIGIYREKVFNWNSYKMKANDLYVVRPHVHKSVISKYLNYKYIMLSSASRKIKTHNVIFSR